MKIKSLQLKDFKCFDNKVLSLGTKVEIEGKNGSGKSTIRESILFALYNRTEAGKETDKYIRNGSDFCEVEMDTDVGKVKRQRSKEGSKLWLNDEETTQENLVDKLKLPSFEVFNSVFTAGYFMSLDYKDQRKIMLDLTAPVDRKKIYKKLGGEKEIDLGNLDQSYKETNKEKSKLKDLIIKNKILISDCKCFPAKEKERLTRLNSYTESEEINIKKLLDIIKKIPIEEAKTKLEEINNKLKDFVFFGKIEVLEVLKSGMGYRDVFKLYVGDKEYKFLSTGEKKVADIGLCRFLNEFYKLDMIFVDNMESVSDYIDIKMPQIFTSKVTQEDLHVQIL